jgi:hypothetical protein
MTAITPQQLQRMRGVILELVYEGHSRQEGRLDDLTLFCLLSDLKFDISRNTTLTLLQNLRDRDYLKFKQERNDVTGQVTAREIQITPKGSDLVEKIATDPAVRIFR